MFRATRSITKICRANTREYPKNVRSYAKVRDVMTEEVKYCFDDQDLKEVTRNMADIQVRRLLVLNRDKHLVGILSLGDVAVSRDAKGAGDALRGISRPGGEHAQTG
jgi:CBS domain-containing protein